ncbi:hypothetical protein Tco_0313174, partial [Tanacetum coccineum]
DSFEDIDYVEASPPDSELVSLEEVKEDILYEKLLNIDLLIACDLPSSDEFSPISIFEEKFVTFSNPFFDSNDDFISNNDESLSDEDVPEDNVKIYLNPLFEFDGGYISSGVDPLFDEVLEDIECKDSYDSNLDELIFLVTPLSDSIKDECFTPCDDVELLLHHDPSISIVSILEGSTNELPLEENDDLFDLESKENDWKKILYDAPFNNFDELNEDKCFDPRGGTDIKEMDIIKAKTDKAKHEKERVHKRREFVSKRTSSKANDWLILTRDDTRTSKETHQQWEYCTKINVKEAHSSKELGLPRWQSVCSHSNPTAKIRDQMIEERKGQDQKERPRPRNFSLAL